VRGRVIKIDVATKEKRRRGAESVVVPKSGKTRSLTPGSCNSKKRQLQRRSENVSTSGQIYSGQKAECSSGSSVRSDMATTSSEGIVVEARSSESRRRAITLIRHHQ
jgi:hypothetical protein